MNEFNAIAPYYDLLAKVVFGNTTVRSQSHFFHLIPRCCDILVLGGGSGLILPELDKAAPESNVWFVDASSEMIKLAKRHKLSAIKTSFIHGTEDSIPPEKTFDVVIIGFVMDMFSEEDLRTVINKIRVYSHQKTLWFVTDFVERKWWQTLMLRMMYGFFSITSKVRNKKLPDWHAVMAKCGVQHRSSANYYRGFIQSSFFQKDKVDQNLS